MYPPREFGRTHPFSAHPLREQLQRLFHRKLVMSRISDFDINEVRLRDYIHIIKDNNYEYIVPIYIDIVGRNSPSTNTAPNNLRFKRIASNTKCKNEFVYFYCYALHENHHIYEYARIVDEQSNEQTTQRECAVQKPNMKYFCKICR